MKTTLNKEQAVNMLLADNYAGWTKKQAEALVDYFEEYEYSTGEEIELDVIAIRCEYAAYNTQELIEEYGHLVTFDGDETPLEKVHLIDDTLDLLIVADHDLFIVRN